MNEWETIAWFSGIGALFLAAAGKMVRDAKEDLCNRISEHEKAHNDRIRHLENSIDKIEREQANFITIKAFDRFEGHLTRRMDSFETNIGNLTRRIDTLLASLQNKTTLDNGG